MLLESCLHSYEEILFVALVRKEAIKYETTKWNNVKKEHYSLKTCLSYKTIFIWMYLYAILINSVIFNV